MTYGLYAIQDTTSGNFANPFVASGEAEAVRMFKCDYESVRLNTPTSPFAMFVGDYNLYHIGVYDTGDGSITPVPLPGLIFSGRSLLSTCDDK